MQQFARTLAEGVPFLRVDFYEINGKNFVEELTFYHHAGFCETNPPDWNDIMGDWITLPLKEK